METMEGRPGQPEDSLDLDGFRDTLRRKGGKWDKELDDLFISLLKEAYNVGLLDGYDDGLMDGYDNGLGERLANEDDDED